MYLVRVRAKNYLVPELIPAGGETAGGRNGGLTQRRQVTASQRLFIR